MIWPNSRERGRRWRTTTAKAIKPAAAPATVSSEVSKTSNWYSFRGKMKVWLARMIEARIIAPPPRPKMPKPGSTNSSNNTQQTPARKSVTCSQPAVPPR